MGNPHFYGSAELIINSLFYILTFGLYNIIIVKRGDVCDNISA